MTGRDCRVAVADLLKVAGFSLADFNMGGATMRRVLVVGLFVAVSLLGVSFAECPSADISGNCFVDLEDFATLSAAWLSDDSGSPNWNPACDISDPSDGVIDELDLAVLAADHVSKLLLG